MAGTRHSFSFFFFFWHSFSYFTGNSLFEKTLETRQPYSGDTISKKSTARLKPFHGGLGIRLISDTTEMFLASEIVTFACLVVA